MTTATFQKNLPPPTGNKASSKSPIKTAVRNPSHIATWANTLPIQPTLKINTPNDQYEQQANRIANQIIQAPQPSVQRKTCACGRSAGPDGLCAACKHKQQEKIQRTAATNIPQTTAPPIVHQVLNQPGRPLDNPTRNYMESRFEQDFSQVRIHTNSLADRSAHAIGARAYTLGENIIFAANELQPQTKIGKNSSLMNWSIIFSSNLVRETSQS